jgi:hypothetical protein
MKYVCPNCGHDTFTEWDLCPVSYSNVTVNDESGEPMIDDSEIFDSSIGEGGTFEDLTCNACSTVGLKLDDLVKV